MVVFLAGLPFFDDLAGTDVKWCFRVGFPKTFVLYATARLVSFSGVKFNLTLTFDLSKQMYADLFFFVVR